MKNFKYNVVTVVVFLAPFLLFSQSDASQQRQSFVEEAKSYIGVPYVWGGTSLSGMDCSGFIYASSLNSVGITLPRTTTAMYNFMDSVSLSEIEIGDIVFFITVGNSISHAGIYIGDSQFLHAASEGPDTGVIVSSLNSSTWQNTYAGAGQFLPSADSVYYASGDDTISAGNSSHNAVFDFSGMVAWNFFDADSILFQLRGGSVQAHIRYTGWQAEPGVGVEVRYNPHMGIIQIPVHFSVTVPYGFRVYGGPVFTFGDGPMLVGSEEKIVASVFPGIVGLSWQTPALRVGNAGISLVQDISWTVFNKEDNSALGIKDSIVAGLGFSTGLRVSIGGS